MNTLLKTVATSFTFALVAFGFAGCGGANTSSGGGSQPQQAALVTGSWSGTLVSSSNNGTNRLFANIQSQGAGSYFSTMQQTNVCNLGLADCMSAIPDVLPEACQEWPGYVLTATVNGSQITGSIPYYQGGYCNANSAPDQSISFTGTVSADGKSIVGTYRDSLTADSGTFNASAGGTVTGTYSGQIFNVTATGNGPNLPVSFALTQNNDGSVTGTGTISNFACASTLTFTNTSAYPSFAFGGAFHVSAQLNQTDYLRLDGITNNDGTYALSFFAVINNTNCASGQGSATKQ
jgi:hypothetical protein